ncbi:MAG TPA: DUF1302 domain-containing protein [Thermoanaerobaculia bacterium]|nr:DUF1302 domain-containing protein [Thermoanaerobaculia bacterium]
MSREWDSTVVPRGSRLGAIVVVALILALPVGAADLSKGNYTLKLDTALSWGARYRIEDADPALIGLANGGTAFSVNGDNGNLNFGTGIVSNAMRATVEADYAYKNFGAFVRGTGFYDYHVEEGDMDRTPLHPDAMDWVGSRAELLDAFVFYKFTKGQVRAGRQVLNWGESTFTQGGLNSINPVDVATLRVPGSELREAYRPSGLVWGSLDFTENVSAEAFYQYQWEETVIDPSGTYFSTADFAGLGNEYVFLAFGSASDVQNPFYAAPNLGRPFLGVPHGTDRDPSDDGQYGVALRLFTEALGGAEFGLYFVNYHSRLPLVNALTGTIQGAGGAAAAGQAAALRVYSRFGVPPGTNPVVDATAQAAGQAAGTDAYASTARYFFSYPEDIQMYGLSWNTQLGATGIALQGEISHQQDKPFLVDDVELLLAALAPISAALQQTNQVFHGNPGFSSEIPGYRRLDATQFQFTVTKAFGPMLGADQGVLVFEPAFTSISGMPSKDELRFEAPGTYTSGNPIHAGPGGAHAGKAFEPAEAFADPESWGYQLAGRLDFNNAIGPINLLPRFAWQHDVEGNTPGPGGNFVEGRRALTAGVAAQYLSAWELDLSYTNYDGAGRYNLISDRDFVAAVVKYSF